MSTIFGCHPAGHPGWTAKDLRGRLTNSNSAERWQT
jgi:hypothetical protein